MTANSISDYLIGFESRSSALNNYLNQLQQQSRSSRSATATTANNVILNNSREELKHCIKVYSNYLQKEELTVLAPLERALALVNLLLSSPRYHSRLLNMLESTEFNQRTRITTTIENKSN